MPSKFVVTAFHGETSEKVGEFTDAVKMALAMWELGLQRPEFDSIQVQEMPESYVHEFRGQPAGWVYYLVEQTHCSPELAALALSKNGQSVIHAKALLDNKSERSVLELELGI